MPRLLLMAALVVLPVSARIVNAQQGQPNGAVREEEVVFPSGDITIAATLFLPPGPGPHTAVVIAHGSDRATRKSPHYREGAMRCSQAGVAVLLADKRGVGDSGGEYVEAPDLRVPAGDVLSAARYLQARSDIKRSNIGVLGGSQGGWVSFLAALSGEIAFVVSISGPGVSVLEQVVYIRGQEMLAQGLSQDAVDAASRYRRLLYGYYGTGSGRGDMQRVLDSVRTEAWFRHAEFRDALPPAAELSTPRFDFYRNLRFDPDSVLDRSSVPVLAVFGGMDRNVPVDASVTRMRAAFVRGGNGDATIVVFPRAGHGIGLVRDSTAHGAPAHGAQELAPGYVDLVLQWLRRQAQRAPGT